jgi:hypothetical protein
MCELPMLEACCRSQLLSASAVTTRVVLMIKQVGCRAHFGGICIWPSASLCGDISYRMRGNQRHQRLAHYGTAELLPSALACGCLTALQLLAALHAARCRRLQAIAATAEPRNADIVHLYKALMANVAELKECLSVAAAAAEAVPEVANGHGGGGGGGDAEDQHEVAQAEADALETWCVPCDAYNACTMQCACYDL